MKFHQLVLLSTCFMLPAMISPAHGEPRSWYVATNGNDLTGASWETAYTNIQRAFDEAADGDTICLAGHTFLLTNQLVWASNATVTVRGGYAATNSAVLPGPDNPRRWPTVLTRANAGVNHRILFIQQVTAGTLEQVVITGGSYTAPSAYGGGVYVAGSSGMVFTDCRITRNTIYPSGGNTTGRGGGLSLVSSVMTLNQCLIQGNLAQKNGSYGSLGGGIYSDAASTITLVDCRILNNRTENSYVASPTGGGGIAALGTALLKNCLVAGNARGGGWGGGVYVVSGSTTLLNSTIANNNGEGVYRSAGTLNITNSVIWGNGRDVSGTINLRYSNTGNGGTANGNISADPLFERGYYLADGSPARGAGTNSAASWNLDAYTTWTNGTPDTGVRVDMGYHYPAAYDFASGDYYVKVDGNDANSGTNWSQAFRTITKALSMAQDGSVIHLNPGQYTNNPESFPLTLENLNGICITGADRATTIINAAGSSDRVMLVRGVSDLTIENLTLRGGARSSGHGGGILVEQSTSVTFQGCVIAGNVLSPGGSSTYGNGGGLGAVASQITLHDCMVTSNSVTKPGSYQAEGGGIYLDSGTTMNIHHSIISHNRIPTSWGAPLGGGIRSLGTCLLRNCLIVGNSTIAAGLGDGLSGLFTIENCTVANNLRQGLNATAGTTVTNSIIWGNGTDLAGTFTMGYSDTGNAGYAGINGNISADPLFEDAGGGLYALDKGSPAIEVGRLQVWMTGTATDLAGNPRIQGSKVDLGAYEGRATSHGTVFCLR